MSNARKIKHIVDLVEELAEGATCGTNLTVIQNAFDDIKANDNNTIKELTRMRPVNNYRINEGKKVNKHLYNNVVNRMKVRYEREDFIKRLNKSFLKISRLDEKLHTSFLKEFSLVIENMYPLLEIVTDEENLLRITRVVDHYSNNQTLPSKDLIDKMEELSNLVLSKEVTSDYLIMYLNDLLDKEANVLASFEDLVKTDTQLSKSAVNEANKAIEIALDTFDKTEYLKDLKITSKELKRLDKKVGIDVFLNFFIELSYLSSSILSLVGSKRSLKTSNLIKKNIESLENE